VIVGEWWIAGLSGHELLRVLVPLFVFVAVTVFVVALAVWMVTATASP
jgi:hypothetical protein